ncbi:MAG: 30S ribosomal protein S12 methylthiotransferase RimO [Phycisphaerae bacterium]|nr:30S ribosomal protein S12 methylthiotransferase RimO [Phycisphaerae bacterium]
MPSRKVRVALVSLGCPKNLIDSEKMLAALAAGGCLVGAPEEAADVIVVNTCGFLGSARQEALEAIGQALDGKRRGQVRRVVVAGCLASRDGRDLFRQARGIDAVVGVNDRAAILAAVTGRGKVTRLTPYSQAAGGVPSDAGRFRLTPRHTAYLRISEGCSRRCTFCTIPAIRGPFRSKAPAAVLAEARELVADGAIELNVVGQDTTSYGRDLGGGHSLARLLRELDRLPGLRWVRLMYAYPRGVNDRLIEAIADCPRVVKYLDLPLQHIADPVLCRMGRLTSRRAIETTLQKLRRRIPGMVLRTTFIVGFPGETERQFDQLLGFVKAFRFEAAGVFEFSAEPGTAAAAMDGQVSDTVKADRARELMLAQQAIAFAANARRVGRKLEVLVDGLDDGRCVGRHCGQAPDIDSLCRLTARRPPGRFIRGTVVDWADYDLIVRPDRR